MSDAGDRVTLSSWITRNGWVMYTLVVILIGVPLSCGAYYGFPAFDDWYYSSLLREHGPPGMVPAHADRPFEGMLLQLIAKAWGPLVLPFVILSLCCCAVLAIEAGLLWRLLCPWGGQYSALIACLVLAPIAVRTQVSVIIVAIGCVIPTILSYGALLLILRHYESQTRWTAALCWMGTALAGVGALVSEYAVAAAIACAVVAAGYRSAAGSRLGSVRRSIPVVLLLVSVTAGYGVFLLTSNPMARPTARPSAGLSHLGAVPKALTHLTRSFIRLLIGSYADQLAGIRPHWDSKSTVASVLFGLMTAMVVWRIAASHRPRTPGGGEASRVQSFVLPAAVLAGLAPVAWMGKGVDDMIFTTRYLLPVLPIGVMVTVLFSFRMVKPRYCQVVVAFFGFLAGYATLDAAVKVVAGRNLANSIGAALLPYVRSTTGLVVAVTDSPVNGLLLGDVSYGWPVEQARRFWLVPPSDAGRLFGDPTACPAHPTIDINDRTIQRKGSVEELLVVDASSPSKIYVRTYCQNQRNSLAAGFRGGFK